MAVRIAVLAVLAAVGLLILVNRSAPPAPAPERAAQQQQPPLQPSPPPMFSPWYGEALLDISVMEEADAARLERQVTAKPDDLPARLKLMAYYRRADRAVYPEDRAKRIRHVLWLIEHRPDSELLHSPVSQFSPGDLENDPHAVALWEAASKARPQDAAVQWNAAVFFEGRNPELNLRYLEATAAADPNHPFALRPLAHLYALSILERGPLAARAEAGLEASKNVWILGNAAYMLQSQYNLSLQRGAPAPRAAMLAERYFLRAQALDPKLDRRAILPQLDAKAIERAGQEQQQAQQDWQAKFEEAAGKIPRLPIDAFPKLPATVARVLKNRKCTVPQPALDKGPHNVIRGQFFAAGETGWAVVCSANGSGAILAFRNDGDSNPETLASGEDRNYLQSLGGDKIGYSRQITAASREFIMRHYRAYGGNAPPPIDHHGIDDAFVGKASVTWYFHRGKWLALAGAD